ncbi:MAG: NifB/NifX family molybdenum-iron cluster-binding protein [Phycisphaerae bacterium]
MKVAIPHWQGRVSPVFDVSGSVLVVELENSVEQSRKELLLDTDDPRVRSSLLCEHGVDVLICGAISRGLELILRSRGVDVISQTCGEVRNVLDAFAHGKLNTDAFLMPGCCRRRRRRGRNRCGR